MLERLVTFALSQRVFVLAGVVVLIVSGWYALQNLPIEAFPDVQDVQVNIVTQAPGLAPEEVERSISLPIEREMNGVPRMTQLRSVSITGLSIVTLTFADNTDDYFARQQVTEKLQNVTLPLGVQPGLAPLSTAVGEIYRYVIDAPADMPLYEIRALQDWVVRPAIRRVSGVADVVSFGGAVKEYQVRVDPYRLRKFNVSTDQLVQALAANNANTGGGAIVRGDEALVVRSIGLLTKVEDIARVAVAVRDGKPILVGDLAEVSIGPRTRSGIVSFNERDDVVQGIVQMTKGQNATKVVAAVKALDYRPDLAARRLRSRRTDTIGLVVSDIRNPFFTEELVAAHLAGEAVPALLSDLLEADISALGANHNEQAPLRIVEHLVIDSGIPYTILRPNFFMENFSTGFLMPVKELSRWCRQRGITFVIDGDKAAARHEAVLPVGF